MPRSAAQSQSAAEQSAAGREALKGGIFGAAKYGALTLVLSAAGYAFSPIYRSLTIQFKVFIQMSGMTLGGMLEADRRVREYESMMRRAKKRAADQAVWDKWEGLVESEAAVAKKQDR